MPNPVRLKSDCFYLRVHVPRDVVDRAAGTTVVLPIGDRMCPVKITTHAKASLRTKDWPEAKRRFSVAFAALERYWDALRSGPEVLSHKNAVALAGEIVADWLSILEEEPGSSELWARVAKVDAAAREVKSNPLMVAPDRFRANAMEERFGGLTDAVLARRGLVVDAASRDRLLERVAVAMKDVSRVSEARAKGDYSEQNTTDKYPTYNPLKATPVHPNGEGEGVTFEEVIDEEVKLRASGREAKPMSSSAESKYRRVAAEFALHRKSKRVDTVTAKQGDEWKRALLDEGKLSNSTIAQRLQNLRTVVEWARRHALGDLLTKLGSR